MVKILSPVLLIAVLSVCGCRDTHHPNTTDILSYRIINQYPHDPLAFTQGLCIHNGRLYEGTGRYGRSSIRKVSLTKGHVLMSRKNDRDLFGEGITIFNDRLYQLTWKSGKAFVYDLESFKLIETFNFDTEGWGLTCDDKYLIMSDGTSTLYFRDPETFDQVNQVNVTYNGKAVDNLNELEYINGKVYANIYNSARIAVINPESGLVENWIDFTDLVTANKRDFEAVLNGIAYDKQNNRLFITGKLWKNLYEIELIQKKASPGK